MEAIKGGGLYLKVGGNLLNANRNIYIVKC
ncbi:hypothetical protein 2016DhaA_0105 [Vibrio phage ICP1]|uniref:Uncharacterized protein ORF26 n=1 Tax=Vibrio phage ICP1 TaxID=979525 RepID=F1D148_9CAUD|nr:hypothetical protein ViPhICP1_gp026 [Vibrio phage ICP1]AXQ70648.1 hypothetical protein ICP12006E_023 [Vibrio phage ICP1_2006_E]AXQ70872.1 hypothetical protein ICP12012A_020 [Vibrio phage ICP1_2012_A]AXY82118.1 hypothetical protein ICP12011A_023 [Vibrio phage ICP1_2011_A]AXY82337.1 hypothetical protein ICP12011B_020 [Vibrio phage ICP1_2011_B]QFR59083.1 hypothetical protein ICP12017FMathbaria_023 [Vibrio phage ICP1_2017_F_Mathbaria]